MLLNCSQEPKKKKKVIVELLNYLLNGNNHLLDGFLDHPHSGSALIVVFDIMCIH